MKIQIYLSGNKPTVVESVPGWLHYIKNIGKKELIVLLWSNEIFDVNKPEHLVLIFFLFFLLLLPQYPSILGDPIEDPEPKIINFVFMLN